MSNLAGIHRKIKAEIYDHRVLLTTKLGAAIHFWCFLIQPQQQSRDLTHNQRGESIKKFTTKEGQRQMSCGEMLGSRI